MTIDLLNLHTTADRTIVYQREGVQLTLSQKTCQIKQQHSMLSGEKLKCKVEGHYISFAVVGNPTNNIYQEAVTQKLFL